MPQIKDVLVELNPWWKQPFTVAFKEREVYAQVEKYLRLPHIIAFTGLRRTGKTTLMMKIVADAIHKGTDPTHIVYFSFDELRDMELRTLVNVYEESTKKNINECKFLLLDEIQKLKDWENQLKALYDRVGKTVKIIISGSESLFIRQKSRETLAGRLFEFTVSPLTFREFLTFREAEVSPVRLHEKELGALFEEYTHTLGFPELTGITDKGIIAKYIKENIVEKVLYHDLQNHFTIRDVPALESLLNLLLDNPGQLIELSTLARELQVSRQTVSTYVTYLEDSFLVKKLYNYSRSRRKTERKLKKFYPTVISPTLLFKEDDVSRSKVFEWLVATQLKTDFFWRDQYKNEVDAVLTNGQPTPIEIKYGKVDLHGIAAFMKKFDAPSGIVISRREESRRIVNGKPVSIIPAFLFFLSKNTLK